MTCSFAGGTNFSTKFPLIRLQPRQLDFSLKSLMQWENQMLSLKHTFISSRFHLSKEEFIMYSIAVGFNGVPLVCFLAPLMTSSDPASFLMKKVIFRRSSVVAMLAASFFQGLTAFYASLLSLNLILVCLTIVCELSAVLRTSYPTENEKWKVKTTKSDSGSFNDGRGEKGGDNSSKESSTVTISIKSNNNKVASSVVIPTNFSESKVDNSENSNEKSQPSSNSHVHPEIRIVNYNKSDNASSISGSGKTEKGLVERGKEQVSCLQVTTQYQHQERYCSPSQTEKSGVEIFETKKPNSSTPSFSMTGEPSSLFQVLSQKRDNQLQLPSTSSLPFHPTFGSTSAALLLSTDKNRRNVNTNLGNITASDTTTTAPTSLAAPSSSMLMMKITEQLGPTVVVKPPSSSSIPILSKDSSSMVKKLLCPTPVHRIKSSAEVLFAKSLKLYHQTKLLVLFINSSMFYYFPVVISVGMVLATLSAYATVKLHSVLPLPLRLSISLIGLTIATVMLLLMVESTEITRHSDEFLRYWKKRLKRKYSRKQLRTCQRLCFKIGPFVDFNRDTIFGVFSTVQNYTVNLAVIQLV